MAEKLWTNRKLANAYFYIVSGSPHEPLDDYIRQKDSIGRFGPDLEDIYTERRTLSGIEIPGFDRGHICAIESIFYRGLEKTKLEFDEVVGEVERAFRIH